MSTIVTRAGKGSPLTNTEVDANFTNLNTDKIQSGDTVASLDINGGTIDGATIGAATPAVGSFTQVNADNLRLDGNALTSTNSNGNIDLTPNGTGEVNITKVDIDAGTIDNTAIGGSTAAAGAFTTLSASSTVTLSGGTANGVLYLNGSKAATSGSALTFDGTNFGVGSAAPTVKFEANVGSSAAYFTRVAGDYGLTAPMVGILTSGTTGQIRSAGDLQIYTAAVGGSQTERLRIDSSGNLGLGVTPSAWGGSAKAFQINTAGALYSTGASVGVASNYYFDGTTNKYITSNFASLYYQTSGQHQWFTAPSGTAGNAISFTQAMTLGASGNLAVGATSAATRLLIFSGAGGNLANFSDGTQNLIIGTASGNVGYVNGASGVLGLYTSGSERARIDSSGNVLIGNTSQSGKLAVSGVATSAPLVTFYSSTAGDVGEPGLMIGKQDNDTTTSQVILRASILSTGAGAGQINMNGANSLAFGTYSDRRLKENIVDLEPQLANIMALRPVEFDYIESEGGGHQISFIAQDIETVYPDVVGERSDGMKTVSGWGKTEARLVKAIQEQQAIIESLKSRLDAAGL